MYSHIQTKSTELKVLQTKISFSPYDTYHLLIFTTRLLFAGGLRSALEKLDASQANEVIVSLFKQPK
jgi:hypothetical protein